MRAHDHLAFLKHHVSVAATNLLGGHFLLAVCNHPHVNSNSHASRDARKAPFKSITMANIGGA